MTWWPILPAARPRYRVPDDMRVYAIGDVHGRADLLRPLLRWIREDSEARGPAQVHVVFLGDLIDRGPQSAVVLDLVLRHEQFGRRHVIRGNHEEVLFAILSGDESRLGEWIGFGGAETLQSYGVDAALYRHHPAVFARLFRAAIPARHVALLHDMSAWLTIGDYLFVHAGIRPRVALAAQEGGDLRWIRDDFLRSRVDHGMMVVHGHTISDAAEFRRNRIGIDTGAYLSDRLTALGLEGERRWLLTSRCDRPTP